MKLKSLWIQEYKNLKDFQLDFEKGNNLSILIGNNGSGKSNVLEAISGIFAEAYRGVANVLDSDYFLDYELDGKNYKLEKKNGKRIYHYDELSIPNGEIIQNLPIPPASIQQKQEIIDIVNNILKLKESNINADISKLETKIDTIIYSIYNLSEDEISIVEGR